MVTSKRRVVFNDNLKDMKVRRASQITTEIQIKLFNLCQTRGERCAFRRFLTEEYGMSVEPGGILSEKEFTEAVGSKDLVSKVSNAAQEMVGV